MGDGNGQAAPGPDPQEVLGSALATAALKTPLTLARENMAGDLRDVCLQWLRALQRPWAQLSEDEQRATIASLQRGCDELVVRAVELIATTTRATVRAKLEGFSVKGQGMKATLTCLPTIDNLLALLACEGGKVLLTAVDAEGFTGERAPALPDAPPANLPPAGAGEPGGGAPPLDDAGITGSA